MPYKSNEFTVTDVPEGDEPTFTVSLAVDDEVKKVFHMKHGIFAFFDADHEMQERFIGFGRKPALRQLAVRIKLWLKESLAKKIKV